MPAKTSDDKRDTVLDYLTSGMSMREYADKFDIPQGALYSWIEDLRQAEPDLFKTKASDKKNTGWVEIGIKGTSPSITIRRSGFEIEIPCGTSSDDIEHVLLAVASL